MLRLKPIRGAKRRGPSRDALRVADGAFWLAFVFAAILGAGRVARGMPMLIGLFLPPQAAQASVAAANTVHMDLPVDGPALGPPPALRLGRDGKPAIAIVIDDLGGDAVHTRRAIALTKEVALAFLPYPKDTPALARLALRRGHEILVHVPMQAVGDADPGPMALSTGQLPGEILRRLDWALARVPGFIGINNHEGSRFTADRQALEPVMERLKGQGFFFDSRTTAQSQVVPVARSMGVESAARDVFLDDVAAIDAVDAQLRALEARARAQGVAIAIGHPHDITLDAVAYWAAHQSGFELVTLKTAIRVKSERGAKMSLSLAGG